MAKARKALVGVVMGSDSDIPQMEGCFEELRRLDIPFEGRILSAHRTPAAAAEYAQAAANRGLRVIIAAAGLSAHLPGVLAAHTLLPVIGVPLEAGPLQGQDALLSIVQMPSGVPVATVGIGNGRNAAILAAQILATAEPELGRKIAKLREQSSVKVSKADRALQEQLAL